MRGAGTSGAPAMIAEYATLAGEAELDQASSSDVSALHAAFSEYAAKRWGADDWAQFGRETGTTEILSDHPRLYRSLRFNDEDYPDAVWGIVPQVLPEAAESPDLVGQVALLAEVVPEMGEWLNTSEASHRVRRRWQGLVARLGDRLPDVWRPGATALEPSSPASDTSDPWVNRPPEPDPWVTATAQPTATSDAAPGDVVQPSSKEPATLSAATPLRRIFVVHGRDLPAVREVQVAVHEMTGIMPESLADQPGQGDTIIEKFERIASEAAFAIVLLTPDDEGRLVGTPDLNPRARQNVVLELGYFFGKLGRKQVAVLDAGVEHPSDVAGLSYIRFPGENWKYQLQSELAAAGWAK